MVGVALNSVDVPQKIKKITVLFFFKLTNWQTQHQNFSLSR